MMDRIKKLLAVADDPRTNPEEAATAAALAASLSVKYNIDMEAVRAQAKAPADPVDYAFICSVAKRDLAAIRILVDGVAALHACEIVQVPRPGDPDSYYLACFGLPHNILLVESWLRYLWESCKRAADEYIQKDRMTALRDKMYEELFISEEVSTWDARSSFHIGFCMTVNERLQNKLKQLCTEGITDKKVNEVNAVVVADYYNNQTKANREAMEKIFPNTQFTESEYVINLHDYTEGRTRGEAVGLDDQLPNPAVPARPRLR